LSWWWLMVSAVGVAGGQLLMPRIAKRYGGGTAMIAAAVFILGATVVLIGEYYLIFGQLPPW
jgi:formate-dependent nitrite reductase membrane component NrfD